MQSHYAMRLLDSSSFGFGAMNQVKGDDMEIVIGKIFFLISSAWAVIVLYKIAASLITHRGVTQRSRDYPPPPPARQTCSEKAKRVHIN